MRHTKYLYGEYNTEDEKKNVKNTHDLFNGEMLLYYIHLYGVLYYFSSRKQYLLGQSFFGYILLCVVYQFDFPVFFFLYISKIYNTKRKQSKVHHTLELFEHSSSRTSFI